MLQNKPLLSICFPVFDREDIFRNSLQSIYGQKDVEKYLDDFEVVISDNNPKQVIKAIVSEFNYPNLHYHATECEGFLNSFHAMTYANGEFIKLQNVQAMLTEGALKKIIEQLRKLRERKPIVFYSNGLLLNFTITTYRSFDEFIKNTSYWTSWSNSTGIWKEDFDKIRDKVKLNKLFPHTSVLYTQTDKLEYIVDDRPVTITQHVPNRGGFNKFHAFSVDYPSLLDDLYKNGCITEGTKIYVLNKLAWEFLPQLYYNVFIRKAESYDAKGLDDDLRLYYPNISITTIRIRSILAPVMTLYRRLKIIFYRQKFIRGNRLG